MRQAHPASDDRDRELLLGVALLLAVLAIVAALFPAPAAAAGPLDAELLARIRETRGDAIAENATLDAIAERRAVEAAANFSHDGAGAPWDWGENLAWCVGCDPAAWTIPAWLASPGHRAVLLGDWTHVGIGSTVTDDGRTFIAAVFARIPSPAPKPAPKPKPKPAPVRPAAPAPTVAPTPEPDPVTRHAVTRGRIAL